MAVGREQIVERVWREAAPYLVAQGYEVVEVEFARGAGGGVLRLYLDKPGGITLDDCQAASELLGPVLDAWDVFPGRYSLEVSSPGFDRPVRKPGDFARFAGEKIKVTTHMPVQGHKRVVGMLVGCSEGRVMVECEGTPFEIELGNIKKANLDR